jgi:hypothetical protein
VNELEFSCVAALSASPGGGATVGDRVADQALDVGPEGDRVAVAVEAADLGHVPGPDVAVEQRRGPRVVVPFSAKLTVAERTRLL